jgi:serine/threonine protein phosphatase PrpC
MLDSQGKIHIGPDHNIRTSARARAAAQRRGGVFCAGYLEDPQHPGVGLQMARSLGDADLARVLCREPEIESIASGSHGIVLVGTDGLFGPIVENQGETLARLLALIREGADAEPIVQDAIRRRTGDNATAIVWRN